MSKTITIKNGESISIRSIAIADATLRHEFFYQLSMAQTGMVHTIDEIETSNQESLSHISDFVHHRRGLWLVALNSSQEIVGEVDITIKNLKRIRHNGSLTIGILPAYQHLGIGTGLMNEAISWAKANGLLRIELSVFSNNANAIKLYQKCGFFIEGTRKGYLRVLGPSEAFIDDILMAKYL